MLQAAKVSQNKLERRQRLIDALKVSHDFVVTEVLGLICC